MSYGQIDRSVRRVRSLDRFGSHAGFHGEQAEVAHDYADSLQEFERDPDAARDVLDTMDADCLLMRDIVLSRRGLRGSLSRTYESVAGLFRPRERKWLNKGTRAVGTVAVGWAVKNGVSALVKTTAPVLGAITGGASGAFWSWINSRSQAESASTWMANVGILDARRDDITNPNKFNDTQLEAALGMMRNAIVEKKVRGSAQQKLEMLSKYRLIRNELQRRRRESVDQDQELNPVLKRIDSALSASADDFRLISEAAGAQYKEAYDKIAELKKKQVRMATIKGALVGAAIGGVAGFVIDYAIKHGGFDGIVDNIKDRFHISSGHGSELTGPRLDDLKADSPLAQSEIANHNTNLEAYNEVKSGLRAWDTLTPEQQGIYAHLENLRGMEGDISINGFHPGELAKFENLLNQTGSDAHHNLYEFAGHHNIDLTHDLPSGQEFGTFLESNKAVFSALPENVQQFILSYPSLAEEVIGMVRSGSATGVAAIFARLIGPLALAGAGAGAYLAHRSEREARSETAGVMRESIETTSREVGQAQQAIEKKSRQDFLNNKIIGNRIVLLPTIYPPTARGGRPSDQFDVTGVDPATGRIKFADSDWDKTQREAGIEPHPTINIKDLVTPDNKIKTANIILLFDTSAEAEAQRQKETEKAEERKKNLEQVRADISGAKVEFTPAFLAGLTPPYAPPTTRPDNTFEIQGFLANDQLDIKYNQAENALRGGGTTVALPVINLAMIVDAENRLDPSKVKIIEKAGAPAAPGTPPAPETFNTERFRALSGVPLHGNLTKRGSDLAFNITTGLTVAQQGVLGPGVTEIIIETDPAFRNLPNNIPMDINIRKVKEGPGGQPKFEADLYADLGGAKYDLDTAASRHKSAPTGKELTQKQAYLHRLADLVDVVNSPENAAMYLPSASTFWILKDYNTGPPEKWKFDQVGGAGATGVDFEETSLIASDIYVFWRRP